MTAAPRDRDVAAWLLAVEQGTAPTVGVYEATAAELCERPGMAVRYWWDGRTLVELHWLHEVAFERARARRQQRRTA